MNNRTQQRSPSSASSQSPPSSSPSLKLKREAEIFLRKFFLLHPYTVPQPLIVILKDIILGTILGVIIVSFIMFLPLKSASGLRSSLYAMLSDPGTVASIEESTDYIIIPAARYNDMQEEIKLHAKAVEEMIKYGLNNYQADIDRIESEEMESIQKEHDELVKKIEILYQFDKWCGTCREGWGVCDARVQFLKNTYGTSEFNAKVNILKLGKCMKK